MLPVSDKLRMEMKEQIEKYHAGNQKKYRMKPWEELAPRTQKKYLAIVEKMLREGLPVPADYALEHGLSTSQYQFCRAAVLQVCAQKLRHLSKQTYIDKDELLTTAALGQITRHGTYDAPKYDTKSQKRNSKKFNLPKKPGWFEAVYDNLADKYREAWAISYCTGLRPDELDTGVKIVRTHDGISFFIWGSKKHKDNGSRWRRIELRRDDPAVQLITENMTGQVHDYSLEPSKEAFAMAVSRAAARAGLDAPISSYTCRHNFAATLKKAGWHPLEIAKAMGHRSTGTQNNYGGHGAVGRGGLPLKVACSHEIIREPKNRLENRLEELQEKSRAKKAAKAAAKASQSQKGMTP